MEQLHKPFTSVEAPAGSNDSTSAVGPTLLVVDDDSVFRDLEAQILCAHGFGVVQAGDPIEALAVATSQRQIDLLITDFRMPGMDGLELARQFHNTHPHAPVLIVSGSIAALPSETQELGRCEMLAKPFRFADLVGKVRQLLAQAE